LEADEVKDLFVEAHATGTGADTMRRLAAPMIGGLATSFIMELLIYPVIFFFAKQWELRKERRAAESVPA